MIGMLKLNQSAQWQTYQHKRKVAIEPIFGLLNQLLSTHNNKKQLPVSRKANDFFNAGGSLGSTGYVGQIWGKPLRNVTHMITLFR